MTIEHHVVTARHRFANIYSFLQNEVSLENVNMMLHSQMQMTNSNAVQHSMKPWILLFYLKNSSIIGRYIQLEIGCPFVQWLNWPEISQRQHVNCTRLQKCH